MPSLDSSYRVNEPDVVAESVGGEVLIINLKSGVYYSADGVGEQIWSLLAERRTLQDVIATISGRYAASDGEIEQAVLAFAEELVGEDLLVEAPAAPSTAPVASVASAHAFVLPVLSRYTDFQELLMLDPIHEVEHAVGWPAAKTSEQPQGH